MRLCVYRWLHADELDALVNWSQTMRAQRSKKASVHRPPSLLPSLRPFI